jgi:hypothetical protein
LFKLSVSIFATACQAIGSAAPIHLIPSSSANLGVKHSDLSKIPTEHCQRQSAGRAAAAGAHRRGAAAGRWAMHAAKPGRNGISYFI